MLMRLKETLFKSDIVKSISTIASGSVIGYAISTIFLPIVSRVYSPKQMGEYDLIISSASIYLVILSLGMITAIMLPEEDRESKAICKLILSVVVSGGIIGSFFLICVQDTYQIFRIDQNYTVACVCLLMYLILYNMQSICYAYTNRKKKYKALFWNPIIYATSNIVLSVMFGILGWKTLGYMLGTVCALALTVVYLCKQGNPFEGEYTFRLLKCTLKKYRSFPLVQMPSNFISIISAQFPVQFLGRVFGTAMLGGYSMACKILSMPVTLLASPVNNVYYRTAAEKLRRNEDSGDFAFKLIKVNINLAIIPIFILMVWGETLCAFFLGEEWRVAGTYMAILGIYYLVFFCASCLSGTLILVNKKTVNLIAIIIKIILNIIVFSVSKYTGMSLVFTIIIFTIEETLYQIAIIGVELYYMRYPVKKYMIFVFKYLVLLLGAYVIAKVIERS